MLRLLVLTALFSLSAHAATAPRVIMFGSENMSPKTILQLVGLEDRPEMSAEEIRSRIQTSGLFSAVEVYRTGDIVTIYVREKTTWFVVPYYSRDSAASIYGLAFGKASINGTDARLVGRYQLGTGNHVASLLLRDSAFLNSRWALGGSFDYEDSLHRVFGGPNGRDVVHRTLVQNKGGSVQTGYRLNPYWNIGLNNYIENRRFEELSGEIRKGLQVSHRVFLEYNKFYVNEGLSDGFMSRAHFEATNPASDFSFRKIGLSSQWGAFRHGNFNWIVRGRSEYSPSLPRYQLFEQGGGRLRSFPSQIFRDRYYGTVQNDLLLTSFNFWVLRLRPVVYADWGFTQGQGHTGVGSGFQIYVRDVAIPAVQFFAGYGFNPNGFAVVAAIGPNI